MSSTKNNDRTLSKNDRKVLLDVAEESIIFGLRRRLPLDVDAMDYSKDLREFRSSFVTLRIGTDLRGCIGTVDRYSPLVVDVTRNAFNAAFDDPRFPPLQEAEFDCLSIEINVLDGRHSLTFSSQSDLIERIRPGTDGLEIELGPFKGLLLPTVWTEIPDKLEFIRVLKMKAGLPPKFWSNRLQFRRFTTESFKRTNVTYNSKHSAA